MPHPADIFLIAAAIPFIYYLISIFSAWRYFRQPPSAPDPAFVPSVSILKPFRGFDKCAYENLASFCRLDYPDYEVLCCVDGDDDVIGAILARLIADFPQCNIRLLHGS